MPLKRQVTVSAWLELDGLDGKILTRPLTGKLEAKYNKKLGMTPHGLRREVTGTDAEGNDQFSDFVAFAIDPEQAYTAQMWLLEKLVEDVDAKWEDGTEMMVGEDLFTAIIDGELFGDWLDAAKEHASRRAEVAEKN